MGSPEPNYISLVRPHTDCKYRSLTTPGLQIRVIGCHVAVPRSYWSAVPTPLFIYISQLLRDSFSVSQQPPIWEPPSHSSMDWCMNRPCWPMFMSSGQTELFSNGIKLLPELDDGMTDKCIVPSHNCLIHSNFSTGWWEVKLFMAAEIGWSIKLKFNHLCYRLVSAVPTCTLLHIILTTPALFAPSSPLLPSSSLHS